MNDRIDRIRRKIAQQGRTFGPPLSDPEVRAFEERHGIELPKAYREFLLKVGNGGPARLRMKGCPNSVRCRPTQMPRSGGVIETLPGRSRSRKNGPGEAAERIGIQKEPCHLLPR
jgi:SMI1 / KNR4 family (SUKH-1)